jgi:hypothetical protein
MKEVLKVKGAGAGSVRAEDSPEEDVLGTIEDGPVVFDGDHESTPPDIIVEK